MTSETGWMQLYAVRIICMNNLNDITIKTCLLFDLFIMTNVADVIKLLKRLVNKVSTYNILFINLIHRIIA